MSEKTTPILDAEASETIAAVDLGSNSFHMIVARVQGGSVQVLDRLKETVRLGSGLDDKNNLSDEAMQRALDCLQRFGQRVASFDPNNVRAVGTNTLRQAKNANKFLPKALKAFGHPIEIIGGREEARLIYLGVSHSLPDSLGRRLVVDIGGGSTEVIIGERFNSLRRNSLTMGCVSYSRRYFPDGVVTEKAWKEASLAAKLEVRSIRSTYRLMGWSMAVGASGTINAIRKVILGEGWSEDSIRLDHLCTLRDRLIESGDMNTIELSGLRDDRRPVLAGGLVVLLTLFDRLNIDEMQVSDGALREGLIYDAMGRIRHEDVRLRTIDTMMTRFDVDREQAERVKQTATQLFLWLRHHLDVPFSWAMDNLTWAAQLHEVGLSLSHSGYQKHSAYLVGNTDMDGFSRTEQQLLAFLVRWHRRKTSLKAIDGLADDLREHMKWLLVLLRVAYVLHRSRGDDAMLDGAEIKGKKLLLQFKKKWLEEHPLTLADLDAEKEALTNINVDLIFD